MKRCMVRVSWMVVGVIWLVGCGRERAKEGSEAARPVLPAVFVPAPPGGTPEPIPKIRQARRSGDAVVVEGRIMGLKHPFADRLGVFTIGDAATLTPCNERGEGDRCPTPWDVCCDTPAARRDGIATVQVLDADGQVLRRGLRGEAGLRELAWVTVAGALAPESSEEALVINATAIYVKAGQTAGAVPEAGWQLRGCCPGH